MSKYVMDYNDAIEEIIHQAWAQYKKGEMSLKQFESIKKTQSERYINN